MQFHRAPHIFVSHVELKVEHLERAKRFYRDGIGFRVLAEDDRRVELTADGKTPLLTLIQLADVIPKRGRTTGLYHFALLLPTRTDLARMVMHLAEWGIPLGSSDHLVSEALYLNDPDGNGIEIYRDRDPAEWEWVLDGREVRMAVDPLDFHDLLAGVSREWHGLPAGTLLGHIHLHVADLAAAERFYVEGLGFDVVNRYGRQALFLSTGRYHHHIGLNTWNGVGAPRPPANSVGLEAFTLQFPDEDRRSRALLQLEQLGAAVTERNGQYMTEDPSGNRIRLALGRRD